MAFTLADAKTLLAYLNWDDNSTRGIYLQVKMANAANLHIRRLGKWDFDRRISTLDFAARYTTGTLSVAAAGTAVTGVGTAFAAADVGKFIRFNGEPLTYRISAVGSTTGCTITPAYKGTTNLTDVTYELTQPRVALPTRFRSLVKPLIKSGVWQLAPVSDLNDMMQQVRFSREVGLPREYCFEDEEVTANSTVPTRYLWVYPAPLEAENVGVESYLWPAVLSSDTDDFGLPNNVAGESVLWGFLEGYSLRERKRYDDAREILARAENDALELLAEYRSAGDGGQREEYHEYNDVWRIDRPWAPGEPRYL